MCVGVGVKDDLDILKYSHYDCLVQSIVQCARTSCELCEYPYNIQVIIKPLSEWNFDGIPKVSHTFT